jgi:hypothetical protein
MNVRESSLYESFNARSLTPAEIGSTFIYSSKLDEVIERNNSVLIGPRGSGKTTFFKMLLLPALATWEHHKKKELINRLDFTSIYIPADFRWFPAYRRPLSGAPKDEKIDTLLMGALFRAHVLVRAIDTVHYCSDPSISKDPLLSKFFFDLEGKEAKFSELLAMAWKLTPKLGGLYGIREAISDLIASVQKAIVRQQLFEHSAARLLLEYDFLEYNFFDDLQRFASAFNHVGGTERRWALCFDELEIAPEQIKMQVLQSPRSFDQQFLIKASVSPFDANYGEAFNPRLPTARQDFSLIMLGMDSQVKIRSFSRELFTAICRERQLPVSNPEQILGRSFFSNAEEDGDVIAFDSNDKKVRSPYAPGGVHYKRMERLYHKDPGFRQFVDAQEHKPVDFEMLSEDKRAALYRKNIALIIIRDEFLRRTVHDDKKLRRLKTRKVISEVYTGANSVFAMCEGNPRWLIGVSHSLIELYAAERRNRGTEIVPRRLQARQIEKTITSYLALLSAIPTGGSQYQSVLDLVNYLGSYFSEQVLGETFDPDPVLAVGVDDELDLDMKETLGRALSIGALLLIPNPQRPFQVGSIDGHHLRLSYLLAPLHQLPLRGGRSRSLSKILRSRTKQEIDATSNRSQLGDLFGRNDD